MKSIKTILCIFVTIATLAVFVIPLCLFQLKAHFSFEDKERIKLYFPELEMEQVIESKQWTYAGRDGSDYIYLRFYSIEALERVMNTKKANPTLTHSGAIYAKDFSYGYPRDLDWWRPQGLIRPEMLYNGYPFESERFPCKTTHAETEVIYFSWESLELYYANITF